MWMNFDKCVALELFSCTYLQLNYSFNWFFHRNKCYSRLCDFHSQPWLEKNHTYILQSRQTGTLYSQTHSKTCLSYYHNNDNVLCGECEKFGLQENNLVTSSSVMVKKTKKMVHKLISECALNINTLITSDSTTFQYESPQRW